MSRRLRRTLGRLAVAIPLLVAASACTQDRPTGPVTTVEDAKFAPSLNVDLTESERLPSGVYIRDLAVGEGAAVEPFSTVAVKYTLWLSNGQLMETGTIDDPENPLMLGRQQAIRGFELGLVGMQPGGRRQILIPPVYGYGAHGYGSIPGFSILVFEVELLRVE